MKIQYKIVYICAQRWTSTGLPDEINEEFDKYGAKGWDLVKVEPKIGKVFMLFGLGLFPQTIGYVAFFKRLEKDI